MTKKEAAIVEMYTGVCMLTGDDRKYIYDYASELMGRPVMTHELASEGLRQKSKRDFINLCRSAEGADVAPVVHARWNDADGKTWCSVCGKSNKAYRSPYCPHCGAKMEQEET